MDHYRVASEIVPNNEIHVDNCLVMQKQAELTAMGYLGEHVPEDTSSDYLKLCSMLAKERYDDVRGGLRSFAERASTGVDRRLYLAQQVAGVADDAAGEIEGLPAAFMLAMDAYERSRKVSSEDGNNADDPVANAVARLIGEHGGAGLMSATAHGDTTYGYKGATKPDQVVTQLAFDATERVLPPGLIMDKEVDEGIVQAMSKFALKGSIDKRISR